MAGERTGYGVVVKVNTGTVGSPTWTTVGSQRGLDINPSRAIHDVSSKESLDSEFKSGHRSTTISLTALYVRDTTDFNKLQSAFRADDDDSAKIQVMRTEDSTNKEWSYAYITDMSQSFPHDGAATINVNLQLTGGWTAV